MTEEETYICANQAALEVNCDVDYDDANVGFSDSLHFNFADSYSCCAKFVKTAAIGVGSADHNKTVPDVSQVSPNGC